MGEETEEADTDETARERVQQKAPQELLGGECHQTSFAAVDIILPAEGDLAVRESDQPVVGDGDPVGVAGEIMEHMLRSAEGRLGVDNPVLAEQRTQERAECLLLRQRFQGAGQTKLVVGRVQLCPK